MALRISLRHGDEPAVIPEIYTNQPNFTQVLIRETINVQYAIGKHTAGLWDFNTRPTFCDPVGV